jgi:predicted phage terminase large subunit-like protein
MDILTPPEFDALTRSDFQIFVERVYAELNPGAPFLDNFHIPIITTNLEAVRQGKITRLIFTLPPRSLKSIIVSVAFPAWILGHDPTKKILVASYGHELAEELSRACRAVMQSAWYQRLFPATRLDPSRLAAHAFETTAGGFRRAASVGGSLTGFGADLIVVDDPMKPGEALSEVEHHRANSWFRNTLVTRLNAQKTGAIVVVMQRLHEDDFVGHILKLDSWEVVSFPAIAQEDEVHVVETPYGNFTHRRREGEALHPERESLQVLERLQKTLGPKQFSAQYLQAPPPQGGEVIEMEWFPPYTPDQLPASFDQNIQSWDTAGKAKANHDFSVCVTFGVLGGTLWLLDVFRARLEYPELKRAIIARAQQFKANTVLIEEQGSGISALQDLKCDGLTTVQGIVPVADKIMRVRAQIAMIKNGCVRIPQSAPWLSSYLDEFMMFPKGKHDDQVDATIQALQWHYQQRSEPALIAYYRVQIQKPHGRDDNSVVTMRNKGKSVVQTIEGKYIYPDKDGYYRMRWMDAKPCLGTIGWQLIEHGPHS